jgi:O-6-methylguanine DNA methyltransferase
MSDKILKKVYQVVASIPPGRVATYGQIAKLVRINNPRLIGKILHQNIDPQNIPCHRVVNARGEVADNYAFGGGKVQKKKLLNEDVEFINNRINLDKYLHF